MPLTNEIIEALQPKKSLYRRHHERGLFIAISPKGTKVWYFRYKLNKKGGQVSLGAFPSTSIEQAVKRRDKAIESVHNGEKPKPHPAYSSASKIKNKSMLDLFEHAIYREITDEEIDSLMKERPHIFPKGAAIFCIRLKGIRDVLEECKRRKEKRRKYYINKAKK